jgi:hypothetical protein
MSHSAIYAGVLTFRRALHQGRTFETPAALVSTRRDLMAEFEDLDPLAKARISDLPLSSVILVRAGAPQHARDQVSRDQVS